MKDRPLVKMGSKTVFRSPWMELRNDTIENADGIRSEYGVVARRDFVMVIPVSACDILMVRQFRYPIDAWTIEFPQGAVEAGETPEEAASRELREETGAEAADLQRLGRVFEAAGYATHAFDAFFASVSGAGLPKRDASEAGMTAVWFPILQVQAMIRTGQLTDASSLAAWALAREQGLVP